MECEAADGTVSLYWLPAKFSKVGPRWTAHAQEPCSPAARSPSLCVQSEEGGKRGWRERGQEGAGKREGQRDTCVCVLYIYVYRERERERERDTERYVCMCIIYMSIGSRIGKLVNTCIIYIYIYIYIERERERELHRFVTLYNYTYIQSYA